MTTREASRADGGVVEQLAAWVLAARAHDLSQPAVRQAKLLLLDTIGCGFAALNEQSARALLEVVETSGGAPQCTVIGQERDSAWDGVTVSGLAAPAMAGRLMGLDRGRLAHAIALSAARAATSTAVHFGDISAAKSIANALVAQNGVQRRYWRSAASPGRWICSRTRAECARFFAKATQRRR